VTRDSWDRLPVALYRTSAAGRIIDANDAFVRLLGYPSRESLLSSSAEALYADAGARKGWQARVEAAGEVRSFRARLRRFDGSLIWTRETTRVVREASLGETCYEGWIEDISEVVAREEELRLSEARFRSLFENSSSAIALHEIITDDRGRPVDFVHLDVNPAFEKLVGRAAADVRGRTGSAIIPDLEGTGLVERYGEIALTGGADRFEVEIAGRVVDVTAFSTGGKRFAAIFQDVTERARIERQHARLSLAVEQATEAIVMTDPAGDIIYVNPAFERGSGYAREEVIGKNPRILQSGQQDAAFYRELWETLLRGEAWQGRFVNRRKDGTLYEEEATIARVHDPSGGLVGYVAVKRDVTAETSLERQLVQAQKMEAVGRLAGGVAHDFNNMLGVILGYAGIVAKRLDAGDPLRAKVDEISKAAQRAASLTRQLLAFSRQQVLQPRVLDLNEVIEDMREMLGKLVGEDVEVRTTLAADLGSVRVDQGQIQQILMNLAANARDALPHGGVLRIETRNADPDAVGAAQHGPAQPGRSVSLIVSDDGTGMDAETQAHMFEPFYTTKEPGRGTGLGLATVYGIVKQSGGSIWVESEVGRGTTFSIHLPRVDETQIGDGVAAQDLSDDQGHETVLLVEDEPALREAAREILETGGYTVLDASDGPKGVAAAAAHPGPIHLLLTDVVLPGMNGPKVARELARSRPDVKVLFVSGYTGDAAAHAELLRPGTAFLTKPFTSHELLRRIRELLGSEK
jgi:PAS domain S-box-containing protein